MFDNALFVDREDAAEKLTPLLANYKNDSNSVVFGLPRGGIILARRIAEKLGLPFDFVVVKKVSIPTNEDFAIGAVSEDERNYFDWDLIKNLRLSKKYIDEAIEKKLIEVKKRASEYRKIKPKINVRGKTAIVVDDGIMTGASMCAALNSIKERGARKIIAAVPVASQEGLHVVEKRADEVVSLCEKEPFCMFSEFYSKFPKISEEDVITVLKGSLK